MIATVKPLAKRVKLRKKASNAVNRKDLPVEASTFLGSCSVPEGVCSSQGSRTPMRLIDDVSMVGLKGTLHRIFRNIWDTGSAITLMGEKDFRKFEALGCARRVERRDTSITRVYGIGAANIVLFHARFTVNFGGAEVEFLDVPVLANHSGVLFGNDMLHRFQTITELRTNLPDSDGFVVLRDAHLEPVSRKIPVSVTERTGAASSG